MQRVFDEIRFVKTTSLTSGQVTRIRTALARDFEQDSQEQRLPAESDCATV